MPDEKTIRDMAQEKVKLGLKDVGSLRIVQGRALEVGDVAIIDIELRRKDTNELIEGSQAKSKQIDTASAQDTIELPGRAKTCAKPESFCGISIWLKERLNLGPLEMEATEVMCSCVACKKHCIDGLMCKAGKEVPRRRSGIHCSCQMLF